MIVGVNALVALVAVALLLLARRETRRAASLRDEGRSHELRAIELLREAREADRRLEPMMNKVREGLAALDRARVVRDLQLEADFHREWKRWKGGQA